MNRTHSGIDIQENHEGSLLTVRVVPRASRIGWARDSGRLRIRLTAPPVGGAANAELVRYLAKLFGMPKADVEVVSGLRSRSKKVLLRGLPAERVRRILEQKV